MLTAEVLKFYRSRAAIARELGLCKQAVYQWKALVPPNQARRLHVLTDGKLRYDPADYTDRYPRHLALPPAVEAA